MTQPVHQTVCSAAALMTRTGPDRPVEAATPKGRTVMHHLTAALHTLGVALHERASTRPRERGSVTIEQVLWAVAVIAIVGIVVVAITNYVTTEAAKIT